MNEVPKIEQGAAGDVPERKELDRREFLGRILRGSAGAALGFMLQPAHERMLFAQEIEKDDSWKAGIEKLRKRTLEEGVEYSAGYFLDKEGTWSWSEIKRGSELRVQPGVGTKEIPERIKRGDKKIVDIHTHPLATRSEEHTSELQ